METAHQIPVVSGDAGNPEALSNPNSPASIMKKLKETNAQAAADTKYDAVPPPRVSKEGYAGFYDVSKDTTQGRTPVALGSMYLKAKRPLQIVAEESLSGFLVASSFLLFLYSIAPEA